MRLRNQADLIRYALKHRLIDADDDAGTEPRDAGAM